MNSTFVLFFIGIILIFILACLDYYYPAKESFSNYTGDFKSDYAVVLNAHSINSDSLVSMTDKIHYDPIKDLLIEVLDDNRIVLINSVVSEEEIGESLPENPPVTTAPAPTTEPVVASVAKPAAKPVAKPVAKPAVKPVAKPAVKPVVAPAPAPEPTPKPSPEQNTGAQKMWGQCGGKNWKGSTECAPGSECIQKDEWYSQCKPKKVQKGTVNLWGKCGGKNYNGPTTCTEGATCVKKDEHYSQCKPMEGFTTLKTSTSTNFVYTSSNKHYAILHVPSKMSSGVFLHVMNLRTNKHRTSYFFNKSEMHHYNYTGENLYAEGSSPFSKAYEGFESIFEGTMDDVQYKHDNGELKSSTSYDENRKFVFVSMKIRDDAFRAYLQEEGGIIKIASIEVKDTKNEEPSKDGDKQSENGGCFAKMNDTLNMMEKMRKHFQNDNHSDYMLKTEVVPPVCPACPSCSGNDVCTNCGGNGGSGTQSSGGGSLLRDAGKGANDLVRDTAKGANDLVRDTAKGANDIVRDSAGGANNLIRDGAGGADDLLRDTAGGVKDAVGDVYGELKSTTGDLFGATKGMVGDVGSFLRDGAGDVYGAAKDVTGGAVGLGRDAVTGTVGLGRDAVGLGKDAVTGTVGLGRDAVTGTVGLGRDAVTGTVGLGRDTVTGAVNVGGNVLGGIGNALTARNSSGQPGYHQSSMQNPQYFGYQNSYGGPMMGKVSSSNYIPRTADFSSFGK